MSCFTITAEPLWESKHSLLARLFRVLLKNPILVNYNLKIRVKKRTQWNKYNSVRQNQTASFVVRYMKKNNLV